MSDPIDGPPPVDLPDDATEADGVTIARWSSETLLKGHREAIIVHRDEEYRLRLTRNNRLILCK